MAPVILISLRLVDCCPLVFLMSPCRLDCTLQLLDSKTCEWAKATLSFIGTTGSFPFKCLVSNISPLAQTQHIWCLKNKIFLLNPAGCSAGRSRKQTSSSESETDRSICGAFLGFTLPDKLPLVYFNGID